MADKAELLVICGPTATGKTALSVALAQRLNGEIVCADSMQIYRGLSVGTAKVTPAEMQGVSHHLVDFLPPETWFSVAEYAELAKKCIAEITARGKLPIVVGGTGLYLQSIVKGIDFSQQETNFSLRNQLQERLSKEGVKPLWDELRAADPACAAAIHPNNCVRVLRALELYLQTGKTKAQQLSESLPAERPYRDVLVGLDCAAREALYSRIDARVEEMLARGLLAEARLVFDNRAQYVTAAQAIGYKELFPYFEGTAPLASCVAALKQASRNYAKRQLTWFRHMEGMHWFLSGAEDTEDAVVKLFIETCGERKAHGKTLSY
ncbi:MAG: tRNA (adenosine(37)-N6)-dimethylallyltransferase MiaA [Ruthenibacterium sp.]